MITFTCAALSVLFSIGAAVYSAKDCESGFNKLGFRIHDIARYPKYFPDDVQLTCGGAGTFSGAVGIEAFARFESADSPYFGDYQVVAQHSALARYDNTSCSILVNNIAQFRTNCVNAVPTSLNRSVALLVKYSPENNKIVRVNGYYPKPLLNAYFGGILATKRTRRYVCRTRKYKCPNSDVKEGMNYEDICETSLEGLPPLSPGGRMDGNDTACRVLHAPAAGANKGAHCAPLGVSIHSSPTEAACRESTSYTNEKFLSEEEMKLYEAFTTENGIDPADGYHVQCVDDIDWMSDSGYNCAAVAQAPISRCRTTLGAEFACAHTCHPQCKLSARQRYSTR